MWRSLRWDACRGAQNRDRGHGIGRGAIQSGLAETRYAEQVRSGESGDQRHRARAHRLRRNVPRLLQPAAALGIPPQPKRHPQLLVWRELPVEPLGRRDVEPRVHRADRGAVLVKRIGRTICILLGGQPFDAPLRRLLGLGLVRLGAAVDQAVQPMLRVGRLGADRGHQIFWRRWADPLRRVGPEFALLMGDGG
jgi:hypothetical protein